MDWSPHMSLFFSLRRIAIAVQIAGWCTSALHVASSLAETTADKIFSNVRAFQARSSMSTFHSNNVHFVTLILRKGDRGFVS